MFCMISDIGMPLVPAKLDEAGVPLCLFRSLPRLWAVHRDAVVAFPSPMSAGVTHGTECDEIQLGIFARTAAKFLMVNLQVLHRAA